MKSLTSFVVVAIAIGFFSLTACTQTQVPKKVTAAFMAKFPTAKHVEWGKESATEYEAEFKMNGTEMTASFDANGKWMETETEISEKDLPKIVKESIAKDFPGCDIKETAKILKTDGTTFEAELEKGETTLDAIYSQDGKLIKKISQKEENEKSEQNEKEE